jgi:hypothetical protein
MKVKELIWGRAYTGYTLPPGGIDYPKDVEKAQLKALADELSGVYCQSHISYTLFSFELAILNVLHSFQDFSKQKLCIKSRILLHVKKEILINHCEARSAEDISENGLVLARIKDTTRP